MTTEEIRKIGINGSETYYNYLADNGKGIQEVRVQKIEKIHHDIFGLKLSQRLFDTDAIYFQLLDNNEKFDTNTIKIIEYDSDAKLLIIRVPKKLVERFASLHRNDLMIFSDLKFLVQRVKEWYETNGADISIPECKSTLSDTLNDINYFDDLPPSVNQVAAIKNIFSLPFTYIWGAPGTGKTQFVLAYSLLHYLKKGKRVAIFGPTNNAIEQVLRGVIKMTDKAGTNRKSIIRLGGPSKKFAEEFPEVCEERGLMKKIKEINKQIEIIQNVIKHKDPSSKLSSYLNVENRIQELESEKGRLNSLDIDFRNSSKERNAQKSKSDKLNEDYQQAQLAHKRAIRKANGLINKITKFFNSEKESETDLKVKFAEEKSEDCGKRYQKSKTLLRIYDNKFSAIEEEIKKSKSEINGHVKYINLTLSKYPETKELADRISADNFIEIKKELGNIISEEEGQEKVKDAIAESYQSLSIEQLEKEINKLDAQAEFLKSRTTEERIKNVGIIASTLDCYIGRFKESKLNVDHLFLDEAGYANIVKALTLFNHRVPITFLGDHMQLPPVCEINQSEIFQNENYYDVFPWAQSSIYIEHLFGNFTKQNNLSIFANAQTPAFDTLKKSNLIHTFRFASNLAVVLDRHVYRNGFNSNGVNGETQIFRIHSPQNSPILVKNSNTAESEDILKLIDQLKTDDFVILCPYRNQVNLISQNRWALKSEQKILTVHGSQGREWDTVILSVVDGNGRGLWFMDSTNRMSKGLNLINTAVSRAKKNLIIVCNNDFWMRQHGQLLKDLLTISKPYPLNVSTQVF